MVEGSRSQVIIRNNLKVLVVLIVKNLPANAGDTRDSGSIPVSRRAPEKGTATRSSILACRIPRVESDRLRSLGLQRV